MDRSIDWSVALTDKEYLALSTLCQSPPIRRTYPLPDIPTPGLLQIWSLDATCPQDFSRATDPQARGKGMKFEMGICVDVGEAYRLKWCPKGGEVCRSTYLSKTVTEKKKSGQACPSDDTLPKLGILGGVFTDGSVCLFSVPDPAAVREELEKPANEELFGMACGTSSVFVCGANICSTVRFKEPLLRLSVENTSLLSFDWGSHDLIAAGCTNGGVF
jgi:transcription factor C subunit 6